MYFRLIEESKVVANKYRSKGYTEYAEKRYVYDLKEKIADGLKVEIRSDGKWIDGKEYFSKDAKDKLTVDVEKEEVETEVKTIPMEDIFSAHWRKRVDTVKEFTDDKNEVEQILEYAKEDEQPDSVIEGIQEYLESL